MARPVSRGGAARRGAALFLAAAWLPRLVAFDFEFTHLGFNAQRWRFARAAGPGGAADPRDTATVLVDPLAGRLVFGVPEVYAADAGLSLKSAESLMVEHEVCAILITQNFDDHCHVPTLKMLASRLAPNFVVVAPESARLKLEGIFDKQTLRFLEAGECVVLPRSEAPRLSSKVVREGASRRLPGEGLVVTAVRGSRVGPPWSKRELGFLVGDVADAERVYYEPHGDVTPARHLRATAVVAPVVEQRLGPLVLVHGRQRALETANALRAQTLIPLNNGDGMASGALAKVIEASSCEKKRLRKDDGKLVVAETQLGQPFRLNAT
ncbi:hypothetical protein M885DRAFT_510027 [Pelagophyceae sp. CCMP2097]|nr:hypothetical protein M885DRAFT_510027 [Pelagophyceae sp. CCMP2097]